MPILTEKGITVSPEKVTRVVALVKDRVHFVKELWDQSAYFFVAPESYDEKTIRKRWKSETAGQMQQLVHLLNEMEDFSATNQEEIVMAWIQQNQLHTGNIMNAFRLAIVGEGKGVHMFHITEVIGKEETIERLERAILRIPTLMENINNQ